MLIWYFIYKTFRKTPLSHHDFTYTTYLCPLPCGLPHQGLAFDQIFLQLPRRRKLGGRHLHGRRRFRRGSHGPACLLRGCFTYRWRGDGRAGVEAGAYCRTYGSNAAALLECDLAKT